VRHTSPKNASTASVARIAWQVRQRCGCVRNLRQDVCTAAIAYFSRTRGGGVNINATELQNHCNLRVLLARFLFCA
jgi:hypothetical protein